MPFPQAAAGSAAAAEAAAAARSAAPDSCWVNANPSKPGTTFKFRSATTMPPREPASPTHGNFGFGLPEPKQEAPQKPLAEAIRLWEQQVHTEKLKVRLRQLSSVPGAIVEELWRITEELDQDLQRRARKERNLHQEDSETKRLGREANQDDSEKNSIQAQLASAREANQEEKARLKAERDKERTKRLNAERTASDLKHMLSGREQEVALLKEQLSRAETHSARRERASTSSYFGTPSAPSRQEVVRSLAEMECEPLRGCDRNARVGLKRKILLKWHPDKQPSAQSTLLATQVMQELQSRTEWT